MECTYVLYSCTRSLENNVFSVPHYVMKVTLHYLMLYIASRFILHWNVRARSYYATAQDERLLVGNFTQEFRVYEGTRDQPMLGPVFAFSPPLAQRTRLGNGDKHHCYIPRLLLN